MLNCRSCFGRIITIITPMISHVVVGLTVASTRGAEVVTISATNWSDVVPAGKEADWIYGDTVIRNHRVVGVIAAPRSNRHANMTVRSVAGALIDLTLRDQPSDQLSCYYPGGGLIPVSELEVDSTNDEAIVRVTGTDERGIRLTTEYHLNEGESYLRISSQYTNTSSGPHEIQVQDAIRADRSFEFGIESPFANPAASWMWCHDLWWRQAYGLIAPDHTMSAVAESFDKLRPIVSYGPVDAGKMTLKPQEQFSVVRYFAVGLNQLEVRGIARTICDESADATPTQLSIIDSRGPVPEAQISVFQGERKLGTALTSDQGDLTLPLIAGKYRLEVSGLGRGMAVHDLELPRASTAASSITLPLPGYVRIEISDDSGQKMPGKVQFRGKGIEDPFFGPDTRAFGIRNVLYTVQGIAETPLAPGTYEVIISRGPEYDASFQTIDVRRGETTSVNVRLPRSVQTEGWISSDFHSHSTPSGDNTSSQLGRVVNLIAEHIEFGPCTEHNRISSYLPHLRQLNAEHWMATCSGMELTGSDLPVNHQNAFPLIEHVHEQDGGGPVTHDNPIAQIERLAMWDQGSEKIVQENHPHLEQIWADRDLDGERDEGFAKMFDFMDVVEIHPPAALFDPLEDSIGNIQNVMVPWLRLLNQGRRIPGVVNTDAHYNFHGSGWLRNYLKSETDDPRQIQTLEVVRAAKRGNLVMTSGPFLQVVAKNSKGQAVHPGDDLTADDGQVTLEIKVQCPNWFDINRVQIFANGRPDPALNFRRRDDPNKFQDGPVKFAQTVTTKLAADTHLIVGTIGEGLKLGRVMGPEQGNNPPVAVANPIYVDVNGGGFAPNGDLLGRPIPGTKKPEK